MIKNNTSVHTPYSDRSIIFKSPAGVSPLEKGRLYIVWKPSAKVYGSTPIDIFHNVRVDRINRLMSKRPRHAVAAAFIVLRGNASNNEIKRTVKIYSA